MNNSLFLCKWKVKLFPWITNILREFLKSFPGEYKYEALQMLQKHIEEEMQKVWNVQDSKRRRPLFETLAQFYNHFCWKTVWDKPSIHMKTTCMLLLSNVIKLGILLSSCNTESKWFNRVMAAIKVFPGEDNFLYDALLRVTHLKRKFQVAYRMILKQILFSCQFDVESPDAYFKVILLLRRLKCLLKNKAEKGEVLRLGFRLKPPPDTNLWLSSHNVSGVSMIKAKPLYKQLMSKASTKYMGKLRKILMPDLPVKIFKEKEVKEKNALGAFVIDNLPDKGATSEYDNTCMSTAIDESIYSIENKTHSLNAEAQNQSKKLKRKCSVNFEEPLDYKQSFRNKKKKWLEKLENINNSSNESMAMKEEEKELDESIYESTSIQPKKKRNKEIDFSKTKIRKCSISQEIDVSNYAMAQSGQDLNVMLNKSSKRKHKKKYEVRNVVIDEILISDSDICVEPDLLISDNDNHVEPELLISNNNINDSHAEPDFRISSEFPVLTKINDNIQNEMHYKNEDSLQSQEGYRENNHQEDSFNLLHETNSDEVLQHRHEEKIKNLKHLNAVKDTIIKLVYNEKSDGCSDKNFSAAYESHSDDNYCTNIHPNFEQQSNKQFESHSEEKRMHKLFNVELSECLPECVNKVVNTEEIMKENVISPNKESCTYQYTDSNANKKCLEKNKISCDASEEEPLFLETNTKQKQEQTEFEKTEIFLDVLDVKSNTLELADAISHSKTNLLVEVALNCDISEKEASVISNTSREESVLKSSKNICNASEKELNSSQEAENVSNTSRKKHKGVTKIEKLYTVSEKEPTSPKHDEIIYSSSEKEQDSMKEAEVRHDISEKEFNISKQNEISCSISRDADDTLKMNEMPLDVSKEELNTSKQSELIYAAGEEHETVEKFEKLYTVSEKEPTSPKHDEIIFSSSEKEQDSMKKAEVLHDISEKEFNILKQNEISCSVSKDADDTLKMNEMPLDVSKVELNNSKQSYLIHNDSEKEYETFEKLYTVSEKELNSSKDDEVTHSSSEKVQDSVKKAEMPNDFSEKQSNISEQMEIICSTSKEYEISEHIIKVCDVSGNEENSILESVCNCEMKEFRIDDNAILTKDGKHLCPKNSLEDTCNDTNPVDTKTHHSQINCINLSSKQVVNTTDEVSEIVETTENKLTIGKFTEILELKSVGSPTSSVQCESNDNCSKLIESNLSVGKPSYDNISLSKRASQIKILDETHIGTIQNESTIVESVLYSDNSQLSVDPNNLIKTETGDEQQYGQEKSCVSNSDAVKDDEMKGKILHGEYSSPTVKKNDVVSKCMEKVHNDNFPEIPCGNNLILKTSTSVDILEENTSKTDTRALQLPQTVILKSDIDTCREFVGNDVNVILNKSLDKIESVNLNYSFETSKHNIMATDFKFSLKNENFRNNQNSQKVIGISNVTFSPLVEKAKNYQSFLDVSLKNEHISNNETPNSKLENPLQGGSPEFFSYRDFADETCDNKSETTSTVDKIDYNIHYSSDESISSSRDEKESSDEEGDPQINAHEEIFLPEQVNCKNYTEKISSTPLLQGESHIDDTFRITLDEVIDRVVNENTEVSETLKMSDHSSLNSTKKIVIKIPKHYNIHYSSDESISSSRDEKESSDEEGDPQINAHEEIFLPEQFNCKNYTEKISSTPLLQGDSDIDDTFRITLDEIINRVVNENTEVSEALNMSDCSSLNSAKKLIIKIPKLFPVVTIEKRCDEEDFSLKTAELSQETNHQLVLSSNENECLVDQTKNSISLTCGGKEESKLSNEVTKCFDKVPTKDANMSRKIMDDIKSDSISCDYSYKSVHKMKLRNKSVNSSTELSDICNSGSNEIQLGKNSSVISDETLKCILGEDPIGCISSRNKFTASSKFSVEDHSCDTETPAKAKDYMITRSNTSLKRIHSKISNQSLRRSSRKKKTAENLDLNYDFNELSLNSPCPKKSKLLIKKDSVTEVEKEENDTLQATEVEKEENDTLQATEVEKEENDTLQATEDDVPSRKCTRSSVLKNEPSPKLKKDISTSESYNLRSKRTLVMPGKLKI